MSAPLRSRPAPVAARASSLHRAVTKRVRALSPFAVVSVAVGVVLGALAVIPLARVLVSLFWSDGGVDLSPFEALWEEPKVLEITLNTLVIVVGSGLAALVVGSVLAWIVERTDARVGAISQLLPLAPFFIPPVAGAIAWMLLLSDRAGLLNALFRWMLSGVGIHLETGPFNVLSWYGLIFVYALYMVPYVFVIMGAGLRNMDQSLEEQARIAGSGLWRTLRTVTLPALRPSLGASVLFVVWLGFALYSIPSILGLGAEIEVLSVRIVNLTNLYPPRTDSAVGLSLVMLVVVGSLYAVQRRVLASSQHMVVGGRGQRNGVIQLGRWKWPMRSLLFGYIFVALVVPIVGLAVVALNGFWSVNIRWDRLSLDRFRAVWDTPVLRDSLTNSLVLGVVGATLGTLAAAMIAVYVRRSRGVASRVVDVSIKIPAVFGGIILAVGFVLAFSGPPLNLRGTNLILLLAYIALYLPQASVAADAAASQVGGDLAEASSVSGAAGGRTFRHVFLPIMLPGLVAAWSLLFARMMSDLTMSAVLAGPSNRVVGRQILDSFLTGSLADVAVLSLLLALTTSVVVLLTMVVSRRRTDPTLVPGL